MAITLADADKILAAARVSASSLGINVSICIVDGRGDPVALGNGRRPFLHGRCGAR
jgi:uncharacterized protein GlcG (DUF336 family)